MHQNAEGAADIILRLQHPDLVARYSIHSTLNKDVQREVSNRLGVPGQPRSAACRLGVC